MENQEKNQPEKKKRKFGVYIPLAVVIIVVLAFGWHWYKNYMKYISTDDAYVESDNVSVSAKILGRITAEYIEEGDTITKGMLLAELDSTDLLAQKNQAVALKEQAIATKQQSEASYTYDEESEKVLEISLEKAQDDFDRAETQYKGNVITKESYDHTKKALESAQALLDVSKTSLKVSKAKIESAESAVNTAETLVSLYETQLKNTKLYAPMDGIVAKRWLMPGDVVTAGQSIFSITNNTKFWIVVYLEETQIAKIHEGQKVRFTVDAFSGVDFTGKVFNIGANTASKFSLIPPNNASGNFTKVTQRIPIKISIEAVEDGAAIGTYHFLAGMSAEVKIIKE